MIKKTKDFFSSLKKKKDYKKGIKKLKTEYPYLFRKQNKKN